MARSKDAMVQRGHHFAIVDEVDSILIDEARTPLIISGPAAESAQLYYQFAGIVRTLRADVDYEVDEEKRTVVPTEAGIEKVEKQLGVDNLYDAVSVNYVHHLTQALYGQGALPAGQGLPGGRRRGEDRRRVHRPHPRRRRWSDGLHQAVEAKERVPSKRRTTPGPR
jgi:preprotein translocase subunit SecA